MKKRRWVSIITAVFMLLTVCGVPIPEMAYGEETQVEIEYPAEGGNVCFYFDTSTGTITGISYVYEGVTSVTIPKQLDGKDVKAVASAFGWSDLKEFKVEAGHEYLTAEDGILYNSDKTELILVPADWEKTSYEIPDTVTTIGDTAIYFCNNLKSVSIPASVTSDLPSNIFEMCPALTEVNVAEENPALSSENGVLFDENKTTLYVYPSAKTGEKYTVPESVTEFRYCRDNKNLKKVTLPKEIQAVPSFEGCSNLEEIHIDGEGGNYVSQDGVLYSGVYSANAEPYSALYRYPEGKTGDSYKIPEHVTSVYSSAFNNNTKLKEIVISDSVTDVGFAMSQCQNLEKITVSEGNSTFSSDDGILFNKDKTKLICYPPNKEGTSYVIPDGVTGLGESTYFSNVFYNCSNLREITVPDSVTSIAAGTFLGCDNLGYLFIEGKDTTLDQDAVDRWNPLKSMPLFICGMPGSGAETYVNSITDNGHIYFIDISSSEKKDYEIAVDPATVDLGKAYQSEMEDYGYVDNSEYITITNTGKMPICIDESPYWIEAFYIMRYTYDNTINITYSVRGIWLLPNESVKFEVGTSVWSDEIKNYDETFTFQGTKGYGETSVAEATVALKFRVVPDIEKDGGYYSVKNDEAIFRGAGADWNGVIASEVKDEDGGTYPVTSVSAELSDISVTEITIPASVENVYSIRDAEKLESIKVDEGNANYFAKDGVLFGLGDTESNTWYLHTYPQGKKDTSYEIPAIDGKTITSIADGVGSSVINNDYLTSITIPDTVTNIGVNAFSDVTNLATINVAEGNSVYWAEDDVLFEKYTTDDGKKLNNLHTYPMGKKATAYIVPDGTEAMGISYDFLNIRNPYLQKITIPTSVTTITNDLFTETKNLKEIVVDGGKQGETKLYSDNGVLYMTKYKGTDEETNCLHTYPLAKESAEYAVLDGTDSIGQITRIRNPYLQKLTIPASVTNIRETAFCDATGLKAIEVEESGQAAYYAKDGVLFASDYYGGTNYLITYPAAKEGTSYSIPDGTYGMVYCAFRNSHLETINIPASAMEITEELSAIKTLKNINVASGNPSYESVDGVLFQKEYNEYTDDGYRKVKALRTYPAGRTATRYAIPDGTGAIIYNAFGHTRGSALKELVIPESLYIPLGDPGVLYPFQVYANGDNAPQTGWSIKLLIKGNNQNMIDFAKKYGIPYEAYSEKMSLVGATVTLSGSSFPYTGSAITPTVRVTLNGKTLKQGTDYTVEYANNINPGTATATITGTGDYTGTVTKAFTIVKQEAPKPKPTPTTKPTPDEGEVLKDKKNTAKYEVTESKNGKVEVTYKAPVNKKKKSVTIPATVILTDGTTAKVTAIDAKAFKNNKKVKKVTIGKNVEKIGKEAFSGAAKLTTVKLGSGVKTIENSAFAKCTRLKAVTIPSKVTKIGKKTFYNCKSLKSITIKTKKLTGAKVGKQAFKGVSPKAKVTVPKAKVAAYTKTLRAKGLSRQAKVTK